MADNELLDKLIRLFRDSNVSTKIGILENTARHERNAGDSGAVSTAGNADIGAIHEFGGWSNGARIPRRSFLRMPLETQFQKFLKSSDITGETLKRAIKAGNLDPVANKLARAAKDCVLAAFDTGGFGTWPEHSPNYKSESGKLLEDTQQLRNSIDSKVDKKS